MEIESLKNEWLKDKNKEFKYKELCGILNLKEKGRGKSRTLQLKDWERYFNFYKPNPKGQKYIIKEFYTGVKPKINNRGKSEGSRGHNNTYAQYIDPILINYFAKILEYRQENDLDLIIYETTNMLAERTGFVNCNYRIANIYKDKFLYYINNREKEKIDKTIIYDVFGYLRGIIKPAIRASLSRLMKENYIDFIETYMIYKDYETRCSTYEELKLIRKIEKEVLKELKIKKNKLNYNDKLKSKYYNLVNKRIKEKIECDGIYVGFKIKLLENLKKNTIDYIKKYRKQLNEIVIEKTKNKMNEIKNKIEEEHGDFWGSIKPSLPIWIKARLNCNYINNVECIIDYILTLDKSNITERIEKVILPWEKSKKENIELAKEWLELGYVNKEDIEIPY
ncbi:hypothetical protein FDC49_01825 [Clostridium sporogenes]|uniref:hypothetical protein n=1 Tax=Clostridium sporogenes TaxID=1509 RepID=UPI0013D26B8E|nr:hypothetical protein [Clostridium sporogenes]NFG98642.1 hypothetical protein [Clostridium sporogenes]NFH30952.1 hypothetical protein [Clostridium sporogenes]NFL18533.1 hypothetical protein [Clostridium sporogenes]NFV23602.1 hypothetical protein [Clostridium sporogenes]